MQELSDLVKKHFPDEIIANTNKVKLQDTWKASAGSLPLSYSKQFYLKPMDMVETNKKYFFDRRQPYLAQSQISTALGPLFLSILAFLYFYSVHTPLSYSLPITITFFVVGTIFLSWNIKINNGLVNILTIDKDWVKKTDQQGETTVIEGEIPQGGSYSFISHLPLEVQNRLSFTEKFYSGVYFRGLSTLPVSASFVFQVQRV